MAVDDKPIKCNGVCEKLPIEDIDDDMEPQLSPESVTGPMHYVAVVQKFVRDLIAENERYIRLAFFVLIVILYHIYLG